MNKDIEKTALQIKVLRQERGWSREKLARESQVSTSVIYKIENGLTEPRIETLNKILKGLGLDVEHPYPVVDVKNAAAQEAIDILLNIENTLPKLNDLGLERLYSYLLDLVQIEKYTK